MTPAEKFAAGLDLIREACADIGVAGPRKLLFCSSDRRNIVERYLAAELLPEQMAVRKKGGTAYCGVTLGVDW